MSSRWQPGQSGNPNGRTPGSGELSKLRASIAGQVPEILEKLSEMAKGGDVQAARLLLERVLPPMKPTETPVELIHPEGGLSEQAREILAAAARGDLAPGQAAVLIGALAAVAKVTETDELEKRIAKLEETTESGRPT